MSYIEPNPVLNKREIASIEKLTERYEKLLEPSLLSKAGKKIADAIPEKVKNVEKNVKKDITEKELYIQCMKVVAEGFGVLEKYATKATLSEETIVDKVNATTKTNEITSLEEICLARGYSISRLVEEQKKVNLLCALGEGGATGFFGFWGLPFNIVLSIFLYYRAVQSTAMFYGYDTKNDPAELMIASEVFMSSMSPGKRGSNEAEAVIGKILVFSEATTVKQTAKKTWSDMAAKKGAPLILTQLRALANKSAQKALTETGGKGLENSVFRRVFEQIGRKLSLKNIGRAVPVVGAVIGGLFDTAQMNKVLEYANIFYNKRFLLEKEARINSLVTGEPIIIDVSAEELENETTDD